MPISFPPRSGYEKVGGLVMFGRTLDKIRLQQAGLLPSEYNLGHGLDGRLCRFLKIDYQRLCDRVSAGGTDEDILQWCCENGRKPDEEEIFIFNAFMEKRGWRDDVTDWVLEQRQKMGCPDRPDIQTASDVHDFDEKRK
jgi:gluconokinase